MSEPKQTKIPGQAKDTQALKIAYVAWLLDIDPRKGSQQDWAKAHELHPSTVSEWKSDDFVLELLEKAENALRKQWTQVLRSLFLVAQDPEHPQMVAAAGLLAKVWGKIQPDKLQVSVDRVAYVQPGALRDLSEQLEARPN